MMNFASLDAYLIIEAARITRFFILEASFELSLSKPRLN